MAWTKKPEDDPLDYAGGDRSSNARGRDVLRAQGLGCSPPRRSLGTRAGGAPEDLARSGLGRGLLGLPTESPSAQEAGAGT
jgi:hypothetical protein